MSASNIIDPRRSLNSKLKSPFSSNLEDLSALCPVESVTEESASQHRSNLNKVYVVLLKVYESVWSTHHKSA